MVPTEDAPTTSAIPDSAKTDLGRISVLWLNGESGSRRERLGARGYRLGRREPKSKVQSRIGHDTNHPPPGPLPSASGRARGTTRPRTKKRSPARRDKLSRRVRQKWSRRDGTLTIDIRGVDPPIRVPPVSVDPLSGDTGPAIGTGLIWDGTGQVVSPRKPRRKRPPHPRAPLPSCRRPPLRRSVPARTQYGERGGDVDGVLGS